MAGGETLIIDEYDFVFLFVTVMTCVGLSVIVLADDSEGVSFSTIEDTPGSYPHYAGIDKATHTKDDYLVSAYKHVDDELWVGYKERGGSWVNQMVDDSGTNYVTAGCINTANGSVVIFCSFVSVTYQDLYMFIKYPGADWDDWFRQIVYAGTGRYPGSISINASDHIFLVYTQTSYQYAMYYEIWNFTSLTQVVGATALGTATTQPYSIHAVVNVTGRFHVFFRGDSGTYHKDVDGLYGSAYLIYSTYYFLGGVACLPNDRFVGFGNYNYVGLAFVVYQDSTPIDKSWTRVLAETGGRTYTTQSAHLSVKQDSTTISMIAYCTAVGEEGITTWTGPWDSDQTFWNNARTETGIEDPDFLRFVGSFGEMFPRHPTTDTPWTQPRDGWAYICVNESGAQDVLQMVTGGGIEWSVDLTTDDPLITTVSLPNGITLEEYEQSLTKTGGTPPFLWEIQTAPAWLNIDPDTGTLSGTCGDVGSYTVTVKLTEGAGRYDFATWTLKVTPVVSEAEPPGPPGRKMDWTGSMDPFMGAMWWLFIFLAMFIALMDVVMKLRKNLPRGPF